jgi:glycosyltransferase involved in cell wall biosynthesis
MKIAFVTIDNAEDINSWSGTFYYLAKSLIKAGIDIEYISGLKSLPESSFSFRLKKFIYGRLFKGKLGSYECFYEPANLKYMASQVEKKLKNSNADLIFSPGAIPIAFLNSAKPIVLWSDATFAVMKDYYECFTGLSRKTIRDSHFYEQNVMERVSLAIFSSEWAATSAVKDYGCNQNNVKVIPYGANIECNRIASDIAKLNTGKSREICKLLFIGQEWKRKGGQTAVDIAAELNKNGVPTELTVVGCTPPDTVSLPEFVHVLGFISKSTSEGEKLINRLYSESHFFILPTIAECTPIVFSEANSFGLPVITTNTGGIGSIITNDVNGRMFGEQIDVAECSAYIGGIFKNFDQYEEYSLSSFNEYLIRLNWNTSIEKCVSYLNDLFKKN